MATDTDLNFVTQREIPMMAKIQVAFYQNILRLEHEKMSLLVIDLTKERNGRGFSAPPTKIIQIRISTVRIAKVMSSIWMGIMRNIIPMKILWRHSLYGLHRIWNGKKNIANGAPLRN